MCVRKTLILYKNIKKSSDRSFQAEFGCISRNYSVFVIVECVFLSEMARN